jgi:glycosyltransferase involved in cell wall biosynthesis
MATQSVHSAQPAMLRRGEVAVCIPVVTLPDLFYGCLRSVLAHTLADVPVVVCLGDSEDPEVGHFLEEVDRDLTVVAVAGLPGEVDVAAAALKACAPADPVLLPSHALVFEGWLDRVTRAARSDTTVGTVSTLGNNAGQLSVPGPYEPLPADWDLPEVARRIAERSLGSTPRTPSAAGHCNWMSRAALELAGGLDPAFESLRGAVMDFSQRCVAHGLLNVVADDVFVASAIPGLSAHGGPLSVGADRPLLERRYPYLAEALEGEVSRPLQRSVGIARRALRRPTVTVDARILRGAFSGAQFETLDLIETLHREGSADVRVLLDPAVGGEALAALDRLPEIERLFPAYAGAARRDDVVHRPYQVTSVEDLRLLAEVGDRLVVNHLDLIAFHNPSYFGSFDAWQQFRRVTGIALAMADAVIFRSEHAAGDAVSEGLVDRRRARVMPLGVPLAEQSPGRQPAKAPEGPFLLCLGNDFRHKNRLFAISLLEELRERGWDGSLVLAGAHVEHGSSRGEEARYLASRDALAKHVHELPSISGDEVRWLYSNASAVTYPTVYEGFGLIPFEAARAGVPCLFAPQASLAETLPPETATLVPWSAAESSERVLALLAEGPERAAHIEAVKAAGLRLAGSEPAAQRLLDLYDEVTTAPRRAAAEVAADARACEAQLSRWIGLEENMGALVGPDAYLPPDAQRALLGLATRPRTRRPMLAALRALYRLAGRGRSSGKPG